MKIRLMIIGAVFTLGSLIYPCLIPAQTLELDYSTYLGGSGNDKGYDIAVDSDECVYVTGYTESANFPVENSYQSTFGRFHDVFVSKLSSSSSVLVYSTYLGGDGFDNGDGLCLNSFKQVYVVGSTSSENFPTKNPYQATNDGVHSRGYDAFVTKLSSSGSSLLYSTYLGGDYPDYGCDICVNSENCAYVTGETQSEDFPIQNPYQSSCGAIFCTAFVTKFSSSGSSLIFSTYLGGSAYYDRGKGICLNAWNQAYVTGYTKSDDFPTINSYQSSQGGENYDAFVTKFSSSGSYLIYSTYLGGEDGNDLGYDITIDSENRAYVTGRTDSNNFPARNAYQSSYGGGGDAFISKFSSSGSSLIYSTYLGGTGGATDYGKGIRLDTCNRAYIVGFTLSDNFPIKNPYQSSEGGGWGDAFISQLSASGSFLIYSTYLGGAGGDRGEGICLDGRNRPYVVGWTESTDDFPIKNAYQTSHGGGDKDAFISRLRFGELQPTPTPTPLPPPTIIDSGDYNGDGTSDIAIFRGSSGLWLVKGITRVYFGSGNDLLVPGDYSGNATTDIGIFRSTSGLWAIRNVTRAYFGSSSDIPIPGDYDGDGCCDTGIFREGSGLWVIRGVTRVYFGGTTDEPVPGYYDGDGTKDIGIFRPASGLWVLRTISRIYFGGSLDETVPGDYNGDGIWDIGIFRPASGLWAIRGVTRSYFGASSDLPVPADYDGNSIDDIGIFRDSIGLWAVKGVTRVYYGTSGDIPVTR